MRTSWVWPQGPVVRGRRHDILNVTVEPSGQRTGCEDDLTAWLNSGRCPSLESLDPRAGADKTLTPGLHCIVPAAPTPVISGHVGQQTIKSPTEVSGPPTLGGSGYPRYKIIFVFDRIPNIGSYMHTHKHTFCMPISLSLYNYISINICRDRNRYAK